MIPLYVLGLLLRYGPQHGYQLKKTISEELADFTQIKLPSIYYHLEGMEKNGLLSASSEKTDNRPEKTIYAITPKGKKAFEGLLTKQLNTHYRPTFDNDAIFYFSDALPQEQIVQALENERQNLRLSLETIARHQKESMQFVPDDARTMVEIIFSHHAHHMQAELDWVEQSLVTLKGAIKL